MYLNIGHAKEIVTVDVYGDKRQIVQDCVAEVEAFINEIREGEGAEEVDTADRECMIDISEYIA